MEQGRVAARVRIVQRQTGDLVTAAVIDALERTAIGADDRAALLRGKPVQIQVCLLQIVFLGMILNERPEVAGAFDQERVFFGPSAVEVYLVDRDIVVPGTRFVFGGDRDLRPGHVLEVQRIGVRHACALAECKLGDKLGQIIRPGKSFNRDLRAGYCAFVAAKGDIFYLRNVPLIIRAQRHKRRRDGHFAIGHHKTDTVSIARVYCACHIFAECVFGCKCVQFIALVRLSSPPHRIPGTSLFIDCFYCPVRAGRYCLLYDSSIVDRDWNRFYRTHARKLACFWKTGCIYIYCDCPCCLIPVDCH